MLLLSALLLALGLARDVPAQGAPPIAVASSAKLEYKNLNALVVTDLIHNEAKSPEIVLTDSEGRLYLLDATSLQVIRFLEVPALSKDSGRPYAALTAPVAGDFAGRNRSDIAVGTEDGRVLFFEGSSLAPLAEFSLGQDARVVIQPTAVPVKRSALQNPGSASFTAADADMDICVVADERDLHALHLTGRGTREEPWRVERLWTCNLSTALSGPPSIGNVRQREFPDIVASSRSGELFLVNPMTGKHEVGTIKERSRISGSPLVTDLKGSDGLAEVVLQTESGEVFAVDYNPLQTPMIRAFAQGSLGGRAFQGALLATQIGTSQNRFVLATSDSRLVALPMNPAGVWSPAAEESKRLNEKRTEIALIPSNAGLPHIVVVNGQNLVISTNLQEWIAGSGSGEFKIIERPLEEPVTSVLGLFASADGKKLNIIAASPSGTIRRYEAAVPLPPIWPTQSLWETSAGTMWHNALNDLDYANLRGRRQAAAEAERTARLNAYGEARSRGDWDQALDTADWLQNFDPTDAAYVEFRRNTWVRKYMLLLLLGGGATIALVGFVGFKTVQFVSRRHLLGRAQAALAARDHQRARPLFEKLLSLEPANPRVFSPLAQVYIAEGDFGERALPVYEKAFALAREDKQLLHAYARALLRKPETSPNAEKIYAEAIPTFPEPALLEYGIGCCHYARGEYDAAGKRLRAAIRGGHTTDDVYNVLTDVYLRTKNFGAKSLPVLQQQFGRRQDSQEFLEGYLLACIDARKTDSEVETLCHQVLEGNPAFAPAFCHLCAIHLQKNQIGQAVEEARNALKHAPGDKQGIAMLAHCYLIQNRKDEEALTAYLDALTNEPEEAELLRVVSEIYHQRGQFDAKAADIYRRSHAANPADTTTLQALAQVGLLTGDDDLSIRAVEALAAQGQASAKLTRQLAQAYVRQRIHEPRAERILRDALRSEPRNAEYLHALAMVLVGQDRVDSEAMPVYENYMAANPTDLVVGRQYARALIGQNRFDVALGLVTRLHEASPNDEEVKRLVALASLYGNKIDEAIDGYRRILSRDPDDEDALVNLALALAQKRETDDESGRLFARAQSIRPDAEVLSLALARHSLVKNDQLKAVEWFQKALKARPGVEETVLAHVQDALAEFPDALRVRWFLCELLVAFNRLREALDQLLLVFDTNPGQAKNVLSALDKILAKDPNNVAALQHKGRMLLASENARQARRSLEKAWQLQPTNAEVQKTLVSTYEKILEEKEDVEVRFQLGKLLYQMLDFDRAIGCFQKTAQDYRWEAESTKALGKCFTAKGMLDLALQEYKKLVVDEETKELLYDLAQRYESKKDLVGAKTVYRQLFAADIDYKDVRRRFEMLSGSTSDPLAFEKTNIVQQMSEEAARRYELLDELGRGAMGIVYRARDKELEEVVALKILPDSMSNNPEAVRRFKIEARNARRISHPHIVRIHDIGEEMGRKYISMEYVDGSDLKKRVKGGPRMTHKEVFHYGIQIAEALAYAHRLGIVHRDVKPANIMLTSNNDVKVTDFGIAKLMDQTADGTLAGAVIGTPLYMSPEQVQGIPVDNRADIYSFGIMLYEFVSGRPPFTEGDLAYQHLHREPDPITDCPPSLWAIIRKCLAKSKDDRWQNAEEIVAALRQSRDVVALG